MKKLITILTVVVLSFLAGCGGTNGGILLSVDFEQGQTLRYEFNSNRETIITLAPQAAGRKASKSGITKINESVTMVFAYTALETDTDGFTTIKATCESVKANRKMSQGQSASRKDAVKSFEGKSFTFKIDPSGRIVDHSQMEALILQAGKKAFRPNTKRGRIKEIDMIGDFTATQWFLWDSTSSIERATEGVAIGQSWKSKLYIPSPMVMRRAREITYTLKEIQDTEKGQLAVITSTFAPVPQKLVPQSWPIPYSGAMDLAGGILGMLVKYTILEVEGTGEELFNIDKGRIEGYDCWYNVELSAAMRLPLPGVEPRIRIKQKLSMKLLEE